MIRCKAVGAVGFHICMAMFLVFGLVAGAGHTAGHQDAHNASIRSLGDQAATHIARAETGSEFRPRQRVALNREAWGGQAMITGYVQHADGTPAAGAVVVTEYGGKAVTTDDGAFAITVNVPAGASNVGVTAVSSSAGANSTGNKVISSVLPGRATDVSTIILASEDDCQPQWLPTFGGMPGANNDVNSVATFDDGSGNGPELYIGGTFSTVGGVQARLLAKWDGESWSEVGGGLSGSAPASRVFSLVVFDDGDGEALYAGGSFDEADGETVNFIARWDGVEWSDLNGGADGSIITMAVHDDGLGNGPALYAGGNFTTIGGVSANRIARWDGQAWSNLGTGVNATVRALKTFDDGSHDDPVLFVGGGFSNAGGVTASRIARWDGTSWSAVGGSPHFNGEIETFAVFDDANGNGEQVLYVGGHFTQIGGEAIERIAVWNGTAWSGLDSQMNGAVRTLRVFDDGDGPALYMGGDFTVAGGATVNRITKWDGSSFSPLVGAGGAVGTNSTVFDLALIEDFTEEGDALLIGGRFRTVAGIDVLRIAGWDGSSVLPLGTGLGNDVYALTVFDDGQGDGPVLYAGGNFKSVGGQALNHIAKWNGESWEPLAAGLNDAVWALQVYDDGDGAALYVAGEFTLADNEEVNYIARWDGIEWSDLDGGMDSEVYALAVGPAASGNGSVLYAGGWFESAGGVDADYIAQWNGLSWTPLGEGLDGGVFALASVETAPSPILFAAGDFTTAGGVEANHVAMWDGDNWHALGTGLEGYPYVMTLFDHGDGLQLYVAGWIPSAGGTPVDGIARWDGDNWFALGDGPGEDSELYALAVYDDGSGSGPALFVGGWFGEGGEVDVSGIAKWDGAEWSPLDGDMEGISTMTVFDDGDGAGPALIAGGWFDASPAGDSFIARYQGCLIDEPEPCIPAFTELMRTSGSAGGVNISNIFHGAMNRHRSILATVQYVDDPFENDPNQHLLWLGDPQGETSFQHLLTGGPGSTFSFINAGTINDEGRILFTGKRQNQAINIYEYDSRTKPGLLNGILDFGDDSPVTIGSVHLLDTIERTFLYWQLDFTDGQLRHCVHRDPNDLDLNCTFGGPTLVSPAGNADGDVYYMRISDPNRQIMRYVEGDSDEVVFTVPISDTLTGPSTNEAGHVAFIAVSASGTGVYFDDGSGSPMLVVDFDDAGHDLELPSTVRPPLLNDAGRIAFAARRNSEPRMFIYDTVSGELTELDEANAEGLSTTQDRVILSFHADDVEDFDHLLILAPTDDGEQAMLYVTSCGGEVSNCPGDLTGSGVVDGSDLLALLGAWGPCADPADCPADLNGDGVVDGSDLLILLGNWGLCPG